MLVADVMQRQVATIGPGTRLDEAIARARALGVRHLPVLDGGALVGIVSDRDLKRALPLGSGDTVTAALARITAADVMTRAVITIGPMFPVEEAARVMVAERISALPVTEAGRLVGIVTETDVMRLFVRTMGVSEPSTRLDVVLDGGPEAFGRVVAAVERAGAPIVSILTLQSPAGLREVVLRVATIDPGGAVRALRAAGYAVRDSIRGAT
jgi:acetoin utilization protein AcuB